MSVEGVSTQDLAQAQELYDRGLCLRAYEASRALGELREWRGTRARVLAGRLAMNLGAPKLARVLHAIAYREDPTDPEAIYYHGFERLGRGPLAAWEYHQRVGDLPDAPRRVRADWLAQKATVAAQFRDFDTAEAALEEAMKLEPQRAWLWVERANLLEAEDRYEEALAAAQKALALRPWYRPAVQATAHALQLLDRDDEALALLAEADRHIEGGPVIAQLAALQCEMQRYADARDSYERYERMSPLMEKDVAQWLLARRCDVAYYCGDRATALDLARQVKKSPFHEKIAEKLAQADGHARRVLLDVPFVRQHHMTCAPATLSAISRFWTMNADHLAVVESICYDGTPAHSERSWADTGGWVAREFTVTWDSAVALIDRGVPFTFTTVEATSAHLQSVVGYDSFRGTLLVRDPYQYYVGEGLADAILDRYKASGPRGMVLVPKDKAHLLDGVELPDATLYDVYHQVQKCLVAHDRDGAKAAADRMHATAPGHRLTLTARRSLATYDQDLVGGLACVEELLKLYPDDAHLQLSKIGYLRSMTRRDELLRTLEDVSAKKDSDPVFLQRLADELQNDARQHPRALKLIRRATRCRPRDAWNYYVLAGIKWDRRQWDTALDLYRFSTCLEDKDGGFAHSYFVACRHFRKTESAMQLLRGRFERFGKRSDQPARTLFRALEDVEKTVEAFQALERALELRPDDSELKVFAALAYGRHGRADRAQELLEQTRGKARTGAWLSAAANLAHFRGDLRESLGLWKQALESEPLSMEAHQHVAQLLAETESRAASLEHLRATAARFPHHAPLQQLYISWLREEPPHVAEPAIRALLDNQPADAWARRELSMNLAEQNKLDDALREAEHALALEPSNPVCHYARGRVLARAQRLAEARAAFTEAIKLSADADYAIGELMGACETARQRREALAMVRDELGRQTIFGDGLLAFRAHASGELDPQELYDALKRTLDDRPDLWHAWSAVVNQLTEMNRADQAVKFAKDATERFPLLPKLWVDLARASRAAGDRDGEIAALREALRINPGWGFAARELSGALERGGDFAQSEKLLRAALVHEPLDPYNHGCLADTLWKTNRRDEAIEQVRHAVRLEPGYRWAWEALRAWADAMGKPALAVEMARELTDKRGGEPRSWLVLAGLLDSPAEAEQRLAALDKAIELNPRLIDAHEQRAHCLAGMGRFDDAAAACAPPVFGDQRPPELLARAAWVEHERGDLRRSIEMLKSLLASDSPNHYGACRWLADWSREAGDLEGYTSASRTLARLWPLDPFAHGYLADAKLRAGDRSGAKADLRRAAELAPDYAYGVTTLFDLELHDNELEPAAKTLATIKQHVGGRDATVRELQLAAKNGNLEASRQLLAQVCRGAPPAGAEFNESEERWYVETAANAMSARGWLGEVEQVFVEALGFEDVNPLVARLYLERLVMTNRWRVAHKTVKQLRDRGEARVQAMTGFLSAAGERAEKVKALSFIRKHKQALRADTRLWGAAGAAFVELGLPGKAVKWMRDFAQRPDARPWMLQNLVVALESEGAHKEARATAHHALSLPPDSGMGALRLWAAYEDAAAGEFQSAEQLLNVTPRDGVPPYYQALHDLARARVAVSTGEPGAALGAGGEVRRLLAQAEATVPNLTRSAELNRAYRRVLWTFLKRAGVRTPLFVHYKLFGPALLVVLVVGVGVAAGVWRSLGDK